MAIPSNETWNILKTLCSEVMTTFADCLGRLCFLENYRALKEIATASFQLE